MEKRILMAVLLMSAVILASNLFFPSRAPQGDAEPPRADSAVAAAPALAAPRVAAPGAPAETVSVHTPLVDYRFSTRGATLSRAALIRYPSYVQNGPVQLVPEGAADFLGHRLVVGRDTVDLSALPFRASARALELREGSAPQQLRFTYTGSELGVEIVYTFRPDRYLVGVQGRVTGLAGPAVLLTTLGPGLAPHEEVDQRTERDLSLVTLDENSSVETVRFQKLSERESVPGPLAWAAVKDKYFLAALLADRTRFTAATAAALPAARVVRTAGTEADTLLVPQAQVTTALPVGADGAFAFDAYLGPQEHGRLAAAGHALEEVNPYGYRWLRPVIRPLAGAILWVLAFLHDNLGLAYGWVLILFGVMMRVVLWPLNAKAMRAQMRNLAVQPLMKEIQTKYKEDPQRQQQEIMKLYKEQGFNPAAGCLPMLIPFPVLITLFFVFQSAIEFRGASFLWLPDLSLKDPLFILPVFLMVSAFALQYVSTRMSGMEQTPQTKMMMYFMPLMMGVFFFNFASGLNLYYATTNVASIPQQLLIARERRQAQEELKRQEAEKKQAARGGKGKRRRG